MRWRWPIAFNPAGRRYSRWQYSRKGVVQVLRRNYPLRGSVLARLQRRGTRSAMTVVSVTLVTAREKLAGEDRSHRLQLFTACR
jgi:hypothetical protein